jgi:hypothetical protein
MLFSKTHESILALLPASIGNAVEAIPGFLVTNLPITH